MERIDQDIRRKLEKEGHDCSSLPNSGNLEQWIRIKNACNLSKGEVERLFDALFPDDEPQEDERIHYYWDDRDRVLRPIGTRIIHQYSHSSPINVLFKAFMVCFPLSCLEATPGKSKESKPGKSKES